MDTHAREQLKKEILVRNELYTLQGSRLRRLLKSPLKTSLYFVMQGLGYIHPYKVRYTTLWGDTMSFYLPEGGALYYYDMFEANVTNFFINFLREGDTFLDVGAHIGYYTLLASVLVGESGKVHSFEPTPRTFISLQHNVHAKKNITVNNNAVLDEEKEITFFDYGPKFSAFNSFHKRTSEDIYFKDDAEKITVKTVSLDKYCVRNTISPTVIKIDAEGAEHLILQTMTDILQKDKPLVTIEVTGGDEWEENCTHSIDILLSHGYIPFEITLEGNLTPHVRKEKYGYDNLLFAHPSAMSRITPYILTK